jgi:Replication-relaxation
MELFGVEMRVREALTATKSAGPLRPTARDLAIVTMVHELRGCTSAQIHARFWGAGHPPAAAYRRIGKLIEAGYLSSHRLPSLSGIGSGKRFLTLGASGRRMVAETLRIPVKELRGVDPSAPLFVHHHEAIGDFRIALETALGASPDLSLRSWTDERELRQQPMRIRDAFIARGAERSRQITVVPDAKFTLAARGRLQTFFLEIDMGTIAINRLCLRIRGYLRLQDDEPAPVLFVVPTRDRVVQISHLVRTQAMELSAGSEVVFITTRAAVTNEAIVSTPIWHRVGVEGLHPLVGPLASSSLRKVVLSR